MPCNGERSTTPSKPPKFDRFAIFYSFDIVQLVSSVSDHICHNFGTGSPSIDKSESELVKIVAEIKPKEHKDSCTFVL